MKYVYCLHFFRAPSHKRKEQVNLEDNLRQKNASIVNQINRALITSLVADIDHLAEVELDLDPRHEAFWFVGGIEPPVNVVKLRKPSPWQKHRINEPVNRQFQYVGKPLLTLRHKLPLESLEDQFCSSTAEDIQSVPTFTYDPRTLGYSHSYRHGTTIPGKENNKIMIYIFFISLPYSI